MDLDFSFALVSSLTPRRKTEKSSTTENPKKSKSLKTRLNLPSKTQGTEEISHQKREEKENLIPKEQLMNKDVFLKPMEAKRNSVSSNNIHKRQSSDNMSSSFSVNMENVAVRKYRTRGRKKTETNPLQPRYNVVDVSDENLYGNSNLPNERLSLCAPEIINISSDIDEDCDKILLNKNKSTSKSACLNRVSDSSVRSSLDVVESSSFEVKDNSFDSEKGKCRSLRSLTSKKVGEKTQISGISETSLSTAYDSDSFQIHRHGAKVIPETPETDKSSQESFNEKRKSSILNFSSKENIETRRPSLNICINESPTKNSSAKRKSSEISESPDESKRYSTESSCRNLRPKKKSLSSLRNNQLDGFDKCLSDDSNSNKQLEATSSACNNSELCEPSEPLSGNETDVRLKKKLRTGNESSVLDMFKLESTIKDKSPQSEITKEFSDIKITSSIGDSNNEQRGINISPVLKGQNSKRTDSEHPDFINSKGIKVKDITDLKNTRKQTTNDNIKKRLHKTKTKHCSPTSPKMSTLVLPSEVIPKFEHINQWLKDTQKKTIGSLESDSATNNVISIKDIMPVKNKHKVSLSPRIKKKKEKAKTSLEEEQKLFEELYGADTNKRLSDDVDEVNSRTSCQDSVEFSENVLDKLYGTVWQKDTAVTQSEPRKGKKNTKNKTPLTERKKHRTSIYEVFSSSSSEDRFEEFLENVQRGKLKSTKRRSRCPGTPEFINDSNSEEDNASLVFYQNIVSSAVKDEVNSLRKENIKSRQDTHKVNRRRLSFGSSKDDCSESGKSDTKPTSKNKKSLNEDKKTKKSRSKKKASKYIEGKCSEDTNVFSLVTPLKIKGKKTEKDFSEKVSNIVPEVPRSIAKSKTPKNPTRHKDSSNSEERLKTTYLKECGFKVPKSASKTFKTPSKATKPEVPSSPALSFLSSLSEMTAGLPCHPDALIYKKNFKSKREELTKKLFTLYNKEVFDYQLPADMLIQWSTRMTSTSGYCYNKRIYRDNQILRSSRIVLSTKILDRADRLRDTLIHELCHAATWIVHATSDGHGPIWRTWADKANRRFPELPVIKRCHDYAISTKFTYKCMSCGYSIGRHTKSLDTERKRCGYCFGKFQVFVTAKMSSASVTSGSDSVKTPRNPTGFALFVKENYATVKKENNVPHAQVMKLLSQKFAEVKISKQNTEEPVLIE